MLATGANSGIFTGGGVNTTKTVWDPCLLLIEI
jgi:hypothetical protein